MLIYIYIFADLHAEVRYADARSGTATTAGSKQAAPVPTVPKIIFLKSPIGAAYKGPYGRETVQVFLLRTQVQTIIARTAAYEVTYRLVFFFYCVFLNDFYIYFLFFVFKFLVVVFPFFF